MNMALSVRGLVAGLAIATVTTAGVELFTAKPAHAELWCHYVILSIDSDGHVEGADVCEPTPGAPAATQAPTRSIDPCFIAQNAMRPCVSEQRQTANPSGVVPVAVGVWNLPTGRGRWVLQVFANGTYRFHSEALDGVKDSVGSFSASDGHWSLKANDGYADAGTYGFQSRNIWVTAGQHGTATWIRRS
jgi:hypothetical protein